MNDTKLFQTFRLEGDFRFTEEVELLPRYVGEPIEVELKRLLNYFDTIDIGDLASKKDDSYIYETVSYGREHDLSSEMVGKRTGISSWDITRMRRGIHDLDDEQKKSLANYLVEYGRSFEDFMNFKQTMDIKFKRNIEANADLYWLFGFYIGRGFMQKGLVNFLFDSSEHALSKKVARLLKENEFEAMEYKIALNNKRRVIIKNIPLCKLFEKIFDKRPYCRFLPGDYMPTQEKKIQSYINGLVESRKGKRASDKKLAFSTNSQRLGEQVLILLEYLGYQCMAKKMLNPYDIAAPAVHKIKWENVKNKPITTKFLAIREEKTYKKEDSQ